MKLSQLKIDPEFQSKIPPLQFEKEQQLEQNIIAEGRLLNPIITWNGYILDGHTRYRILKKHGFIKFEVEEIQLANKYEALASIPKEERPAILEELKKKKSDRDDTILERLKPSKPPPKPKSAPQKKSQRQRKTTRRRRQNSRKRQYRHQSPSPRRKRKLSRPAMRHQVFFRAYRVINGTCPKKTRPDCRPRWMPVTRIKQQQPAPSCCANCREQRKILFFDGMLSFKNTRRF